MRRLWVQLRSTVPGSFLAALGLSAGFLAFVAWDQSHWWRVKEDYSFGWLLREGRAGLFADARTHLVGLFLFPVLVWLVSAPMVSAVETQLNLALLRKVVTVVAFVFETLGVPIEQQGNVLALPNGNVGVED